MTDDDFPIDEGSAATVAAALRAASPTSARMVDEHEDYFDEVLSTVLLADVGRWYREAHAAGSTDEVTRAVDALARLYARSDEGLETVIATGFLEALPQPDEADRWVVERLPAVLRDELSRMEAWRPGS